MTTTEEVRRLQREGKSDQDIIGQLKKSGVPEREVIDAVSQTKIRDAVFSDDNEEGQEADNLGIQNNYSGGMSGQTEMNAPTPGQYSQYSEEYSSPDSGEYSEMQPSMLASGSGEQQEYYPQTQAFQGEEIQGSQDAYGAYPQYQPYQEAMSSDMITEISEQVVTEKLSVLQDRLEKVIDMKTVMDAKISSVSERLMRIEKIIDRLQLSLLQKVGEYVNDVDNVRKELEETQKSFASLHRKKAVHHPTHHVEHHEETHHHKKR